MTKKDYIKISKVIKETSFGDNDDLDDDDYMLVGELARLYHTRRKLASAMADMLKEDNPRMKRDLFMAACGF